MRIVCIIIARAESKSIPNKNIINFCGKNLIEWTILQSLASNLITEVWVSSDSNHILEIAHRLGVNIILRPKDFAMDNSSSESAWLHALEFIEKNKSQQIDYLICPQVTSPLRSSNDFTQALKLIFNSDADSMLSVTEIEDHFIWKRNNLGTVIPENYDYKDRKPRQLIEKKYLENGSFYIFKPDILKKFNNRLGGKITFYPMPKYKMFQIDHPDDIDLCEVIMRGYNLINL